jgi:hypothetical protein
VRRSGAAPLALIAALSLAACGSGTSKSTSSTRTTTSARRPAARTTLAVGEAYQVSNAGGAFLAVTVAKVIDPLGDSGAALPPGTRAVGVKLDILDHGPVVYDSSATGDVSLVLSSGAAVPTFAPRGACQTPLRDFDNQIAPGEHHHGCVVFSVPNGAKVSGVRFAPHGNRAVPYIWSVS